MYKKTAHDSWPIRSGIRSGITSMTFIIVNSIAFAFTDFNTMVTGARVQTWAVHRNGKLASIIKDAHFCRLVNYASSEKFQKYFFTSLLTKLSSLSANKANLVTDPIFLEGVSSNGILEISSTEWNSSMVLLDVVTYLFEKIISRQREENFRNRLLRN